ncbi:hypothetical protein LIER_30332 [Lithospermum erythrorhizon]|uniref:Helitron helicase-like domain-containing protein n=1 Tax=Lithospermum erythrorhizon TaxID=34254 RepID=A0AAV3RNC6_LITER
MFPSGETGWHGNIPRIGSSVQRNKRNLQPIITNCNSFEDLLEQEERGISRRTFYDALPEHDVGTSNESKRRKCTTIKELLQLGEESHNLPDLLARVFKAKLNIMHDKLMSGEIFLQVASTVHVVEFQKRGLPHAHFLISLKPQFKLLTPEAYDRVVCAELPDRSVDPYFYSLVVNHMTHGPCENLNASNVCMKDGKCKNHYPKEHTQYTTHGTGSYPIYR